MIQPFRGILPHGPICDLVTPFTADRFDKTAFVRLIGEQRQNGVAGLLVCGPSGEPWSLDDGERASVIGACVRAAGTRLPVIAGTGTPSTARTVELTVAAKSLGAAAAYIVMPFYNKPSQEGIFRHYETVCQKVDLPIIVGIAPHRTAVDLASRTLERLAQLPGIVAICDETGDIGRLTAVSASLRRRFAFYSGHEPTAAVFCLAGGQGAISAAANLVPGPIVALHRAIANRDVPLALELADRLNPLLQLLTREGTPAAIKCGLNLRHGVTAEVRLPVTPVAAGTAADIRMAIAEFEEQQGQPIPVASRAARSAG